MVLTLPLPQDLLSTLPSDLSPKGYGPHLFTNLYLFSSNYNLSPFDIGGP